VGLCLIVTFALGAIISEGAQASTEIAICTKVEKSPDKLYHGHYLDKKCTVASGTNEGKYEYDVGARFSEKGNAVKLVSAQLEVACKKSRGSATVLDPTRFQATFTFLKCTKGRHSYCTTQGLKPGEIETKLLLGVIGENAGKEVFVSFTGKEAGSTEPAPAESFAEFECGETRFVLHGTLSGRWTGVVNTPTKGGGVNFAVGAGEQGLIEQFINPISKEPEEEAASLEATQPYKLSHYEMKQD
jgi:hypothetical protein